MMKWLDFFTIKQKLAILLLFLLSAVSYLTFNTISNSDQQSKKNIEIEVAQQQKLLAQHFINSVFFAKQRREIDPEDLDNSRLNKNIFLFEANIKAMLKGGKAYPTMSVENSITLMPLDVELKHTLQQSNTIWKELQASQKTLTGQAVTMDQLFIFQHLADNLLDALTHITTALLQQQQQQLQQSQLIVQLSWLFIVVIGTLFYWLIATNIIQPLANITKAASRIRLGDLQTYPINNSHRDELGTLIYQSDEMRLTLSKLMQAIQRHNKQIVHSSAQLNELSEEMSAVHRLQYEQHTDIMQQLDDLQQHNTQYIEQLTEHYQHNHGAPLPDTLNAHTKQHQIQLTKLRDALQNALQLTIETNQKSDSKVLFIKDLNKISHHLYELSHEFKTDQKDNIIRRGNDKRLHPRISNQLKISLQQADLHLQGITQDISLSGMQIKSVQSVKFIPDKTVTFTINIPNRLGEKGEQCINLLGHVINEKQQGKFFYYRVSFHSINEKEHEKMQLIFDYFDERSEFNN